ncbi:MAG: hypothetical protein M0P58_03065 [Bacteroidales bacterium]|jgi:hypothetical protein|nr:hypothetical protein [Bacteroidales bacterium]
MQNQPAKGISYVFHPLLVPAYTLLLLLNINNAISLMIPVDYKMILLGIVVLTTFIFPLFFAFLLYRLHVISSFFLEQKEERTYLILGVAIFYYLTYYLLKGISLSVMFSYYMLGCTILAILTLIINFYFKISFHMIGIGSLTGLLLGLSLKYGLQTDLFLFGSILAGGIIGYARLKLNAHHPVEVYTGFFLGVVVISTLIILH